jgi:hypothetical protein
MIEVDIGTVACAVFETDWGCWHDLFSFMGVRQRIACLTLSLNGGKRHATSDLIAMLQEEIQGRYTASSLR